MAKDIWSHGKLEPGIKPQLSPNWTKIQNQRAQCFITLVWLLTSSLAMCVKPLSQCLLHYTQTGDYMVALWMRVHAFASMYLSVRARESIYALLLLWVKSTCMFHARLMVHFKWSMANPSVLFTLIYWCFPTAPYFCHVFNWQQLYIPDSFSID